MEKKKQKADIIRVMSILGITSVLITILSDFILIGKPNSAYSFLKLGTESMWDISATRIAVGAFIGVVVLPFQLLGLVPVYFALKPAGKVLPLMAVIINAHTLLMGVAFHISYAFIGSGWALHHQEEVQSVTSGLIARFGSYWWILAIIMLIELSFCSAVFIITVLKGNTLFPKWMAVFNPIGVLAITFPFIFILPYPIGGYIAPAYLNISTMIFFIVTLKVGYSKIEEQDNHRQN